MQGVAAVGGSESFASAFPHGVLITMATRGLAGARAWTALMRPI